MKKTILILTLCLTCICTHAQKIDKKLLNGRWDLYSMNSSGHNMCRDSVTETIRAAIRSRRADDPARQITAADSMALADTARVKLADIFKTFMTFDENGQTKMMLGFEKDENGKFSEDSGTYEWTGENKILQKLSEGPPVTIVIVSLTATRLVIQPEATGEDSGDLAMTFTRAK